MKDLLELILFPIEIGVKFILGFAAVYIAFALLLAPWAWFCTYILGIK